MSDECQEGGTGSAANADFACLAQQARLYSLLAFLKPLTHEFALQREIFIQSKILHAPKQLALKTTPARRKQAYLRYNPLPKELRVFHV